MEWFDADVELPECGVDVLIYAPYYGIVTAGYIDFETGEWMASIGDYRIRHDVTLWMPMPEVDDGD